MSAGDLLREVSKALHKATPKNLELPPGTTYANYYRSFSKLSTHELDISYDTIHSQFKNLILQEPSLVNVLGRDLNKFLRLATRGKNNGTWQAWRTVWDSSNLTNLNQLTNGPGYTTNTGTVTSIVAGTGLSGGTITTTGTIALANTEVTAGSYTNANITVDAQGRITAASSGSGGVTSVNGQTGAVTVSASPGGSNTHVQYNSSGSFAGSANLTFDGTNLGCGGNITAYSDDTLKHNWVNLPSNFISELSKVKSGIYDRLDQELTQVGVSAQSLRQILPEAVVEDSEGLLSVSYGNAAMVASIELAKEVLELKSQIAELSLLVAKLKLY